MELIREIGKNGFIIPDTKLLFFSEVIYRYFEQNRNDIKYVHWGKEPSVICCTNNGAS